MRTCLTTWNRWSGKLTATMADLGKGTHMRIGRDISLFRMLLLVVLMAGYGRGGGWAFAADTTAPTVSSTKPADTATGVFINSNISANFSEAMAPATITAPTTFTLKQGATTVGGVVTYSGITATFSPTGGLSPDLPYTATIRGGATGSQDLSGNALASDYVWSFTTGALSRQGPVNLGSCATFIALAYTTVTSTGGGAYKGNIGVYPGSAVTGFPPAVVTPPYSIHATDDTAKQAQADLLVAYNDAAGRSLAPITLSGNQGGKTLTPGLYKSTSSLAVSSGDLTLDAQGDPNGVFIFQMGSTLDMTSGRQIILSGSAKASNIFWQVGSSATFGTTTVIKGTVLALTSITMLAGATLEGRALALNGAVTLNNGDTSGNVGIPGPIDNTPPTVSSTVPADVDVSVATNRNLAATFSEAMDPATITTATTFTLQQGNTPVTGVVTYTGTTATFNPNSILADNTTYTAIITTEAKDLDGNRLENDFAWTFTTGATPDTTPPAVSSTVPPAGATGVAIDANLTATFSEAMDPATITTATFALKQGATPVAGAVTYVGTMATFNPTGNLAPSVPFTATITTGAKDLAGNGLASDYVWSFTTTNAGTSAHDLALTNLMATPNPVRLLSTTKFSYTVANKGSVTEMGLSFRLTHNGRLLARQSIAIIQAGKTSSGAISVKIPLGTPRGDYFIIGQVVPVQGETNTDDNTQTVKVTVK